MNTCTVGECSSQSKKRGLCHKHYMRVWRYGSLSTLEKTPPEDRFWAKVNKTDTCWLWKASVSGYGYGQFKVAGKMLKAHRYSYALKYGEIKNNLTVDHLCRNILCVNPEHMELVTSSENTKRARAVRPLKTHCVKGHKFDEANTYYYKNGHRGCRTCGKLSARTARAKRRHDA